MGSTQNYVWRVISGKDKIEKDAQRGFVVSMAWSFLLFLSQLGVIKVALDNINKSGSGFNLNKLLVYSGLSLSPKEILGT